MGNSEMLDEMEVEKMVLKFPRALFEEVIARIEEKKTTLNSDDNDKGEDNSSNKSNNKNINDTNNDINNNKKRKNEKIYHTMKRHRSDSPPLSPDSPSFSFCSLFSSPEEEKERERLNEGEKTEQKMEGIEDKKELEIKTEIQILPIPLPMIDLQQNSEEDKHRPERESKKKFYSLLSSVIAGDMCPQHFDTSHVNQLNSNKPKLLSKQHKRDIIKSMSVRRHFPAEILSIEGKGTGVKTLRPLSRYQFICEYAGELITKTEALRREKFYAATSNTRIMSCYMYYFEHRGQELCLDATSENGAWGIGRLINHSVNGNLDTVKLVVEGVPRLAFVANRDIEAGDELAYDYGDRTSYAAFPWLKK